jgi:hypothetical protein
MAMRLWLLSILGWPAALVGQTRPVCRPADSETIRVVEQLRRDMNDPSSLGQQQRRLVQLPAGNDVAISLVTDEQACRKARAAYVSSTRSYDRETGQWNTPATRVYVLRVDTLYYVWDPGTMMGEWQLVTTLDAHFNTVTSAMR